MPRDARFSNQANPPDLRITPDQELITRLRAGEAWVFDMIMRDYQTNLYLYAVRVVLSPDLAADVVQDVFVRLWETRSSLDIHGSLRGYLFSSVRNAAITMLRSEAARSQREASADIQSEASYARPSDAIEMTEFARAVQEVIDDLPDRCREIFLLVREQDLTYVEVADMLEISLSTVKTQMSRAMTALAKRLTSL